MEFVDIESVSNKDANSLESVRNNLNLGSPVNNVTISYNPITRSNCPSDETINEVPIVQSMSRIKKITAVVLAILNAVNLSFLIWTVIRFIVMILSLQNDYITTKIEASLDYHYQGYDCPHYLYVSELLDYHVTKGKVFTLIRSIPRLSFVSNVTYYNVTTKTVTEVDWWLNNKYEVNFNFTRIYWTVPRSIYDNKLTRLKFTINYYITTDLHSLDICKNHYYSHDRIIKNIRYYYYSNLYFQQDKIPSLINLSTNIGSEKLKLLCPYNTLTTHTITDLPTLSPTMENTITKTKSKINDTLSHTVENSITQTQSTTYTVNKSLSLLRSKKTIYTGNNSIGQSSPKIISKRKLCSNATNGDRWSKDESRVADDGYERLLYVFIIFLPSNQSLLICITICIFFRPCCDSFCGGSCCDICSEADFDCGDSLEICCQICEGLSGACDGL